MKPRLSDEKILRVLEAGPSTIDEVAKAASISRAEAQARLYKLSGEGRVRYIRKGRVNIFSLPERKQHLTFTLPPWVKPRSPNELVKELEQYWTEVSAQDMVGAERGHY